MAETNLQRRQFSRWTVAALGGLVAGASGSKLAAQEEKDDKLPIDPNLLLKAPNTCKGLNSCKGEGKGTHACAGQSSCATVGKHECAGMNDCKGQGGCGGYPGQNTCKGKGHCAVPLGADTWKLARKQFEEVAKLKGVKIGPAPK